MQTRQIVKALNSYQKTCCPDNVTSAFRRADVVTYWDAGHQGFSASMDRSIAADVGHSAFGKHRVGSPPVEQQNRRWPTLSSDEKNR
jgi:hypothetical protein